MTIASLAHHIANNKRILTGLGLGLLFLTFEAVIHVLVLHQHTNVLDEIFTSDLHESLLRLFIVLLFLGFAVHVQVEEKRRAARDREMVFAGIEWKRTFDAIPDFIAIIDLEFRIRRVNKAMARRFAVEPESLIGSVCYERVHGLAAPPSYCPHRTLLEDHREHTAEIHEERLGGDYIVTVSPLWDQNGRLIGCTHVARDISERKRAEAELRSSNALLQRQLRFTETLLKAEPIAVFFKDAEGRYLGCNEDFSKIVGVTPEEIVGKTVFDLWSPELAEVYYRQDKALLANPGHQTYEFKVRKVGGELIDVIFNKDVFSDESGAVGGIVGTLLDITERKRAEEQLNKMNESLEQRVAERTAELLALNAALEQEIGDRLAAEATLRKSEEKFRTLFEESFDGLFITSPGGRILDMNKKGVAMLGYETKEDVLSLDLSREVYANPQDRQRILAMVNERGTAEYEVEIKKKSGEKMVAYCALTAVKDERGGITSYRGIIRDITERKRAEEMLKSYAKRLRTLSAGLMAARESERRHIAHELHDEIGQSLTGVKLSLDAIRRKADGAAAADLSGVQDELSNLMVRVRDLALNLRPSLLDTLGLLPTLQWHFKRYAEQTGIQVDFHHDGENQRLPAEIETAIFRVVQEALTNVARHACVESVKVELMIGEQGAGILIEDHGTGFNVNAAMENGRTMGLAGMRERVDGLGGSLSIQSAQGSGTKLTVRLPVTASPSDHESRMTGDPPAPDES